MGGKHPPPEGGTLFAKEGGARGQGLYSPNRSLRRALRDTSLGEGGKHPLSPSMRGNGKHPPSADGTLFAKEGGARGQGLCLPDRSLCRALRDTSLGEGGKHPHSPSREGEWETPSQALRGQLPQRGSQGGLDLSLWERWREAAERTTTPALRGHPSREGNEG